jgi:hypothetical protein
MCPIGLVRFFFSNLGLAEMLVRNKLIFGQEPLVFHFFSPKQTLIQTAIPFISIIPNQSTPSFFTQNRRKDSFFFRNGNNHFDKMHFCNDGIRAENALR